MRSAVSTGRPMPFEALSSSSSSPLCCIRAPHVMMEARVSSAFLAFRLQISPPSSLIFNNAIRGSRPNRFGSDSAREDPPVNRQPSENQRPAGVRRASRYQRSESKSKGSPPLITSHIHNSYHQQASKMRTTLLLPLFSSSLSLGSAFILPQSSSRPRAAGEVRMMAVSAPKSSYDITLLPGDGIGPEIMGATVRSSS